MLVAEVPTKSSGGSQRISFHEGGQERGNSDAKERRLRDRVSEGTREIGINT